MVDTATADLRVLLALRIRGVADTTTVATRAGLSENDAANALDSLAGIGEVQYKDRGNSGSYWLVTPEGDCKVLALLAEELDAVGTRVALTETYQQFLAVDFSFKELCTDFQLLPGDDSETRQLNNHADQDYDATVITRLCIFDGKMQAIYADFATHLERLSGFGLRFTYALEHVQAGDHSWFASPLVESYHDVWQELHYNLQSTLGIDRAFEEVVRATEEESYGPDEERR